MYGRFDWNSPSSYKKSEKKVEKKTKKRTYLKTFKKKLVTLRLFGSRQKSDGTY